MKPARVLQGACLLLLACVAHGRPVEMHGMYRYLADAATFTDCHSGITLPVAMEGDNRALERAYLQAGPAPGEPLLVTLEVRIVQRMPMEGPGPVATLVPVRFVAVHPGERCQADGTAPGLVNTDWRLTRLGEAAAVHFPDQREVHIRLQQNGRVNGADGCNLLNGGFSLAGNSLSFTRLAKTMMACSQGREQSQAFTAALGHTARYRIVDGHLELLDADGSVLARFAPAPDR